MMGDWALMSDWASWGRFANRPYGAGIEIYCREGSCQGGSAFGNKLQAMFILIIKTDGFKSQLENHKFSSRVDIC
jgi:hypothetical protein